MVSYYVLHRFGRGEAVVVIVLKTLENAIHDRDHIYATVSFQLILSYYS